MSRKIEMIGHRFGRLVVLEEAPAARREAHWLCRCDCGDTKIIRGVNLRRGKTESCGCIVRDMGKARKVGLQGQKFGRLTVVCEADRQGRHGVYWRCACDCGETTDVSAILLTTGNTRSCGCLLREVSAERLRGRIPENRLPVGDSALTKVFVSYRNRARGKGWEFSLTKEQCHELMEQPCFYCGVEPQQVSRANDYSSWVYNGIDRVDCGKGYTPDNVVPCCGTCNKAKLTSSSGDFVIWVERTYANLKKKGVL